MNTIIQNASGPAEAATSPDHGSIIPSKDFEMNGHITNTTMQVAPLLQARKSIEDTIEFLIDLLDHMDGDPDLENDEGEPSEATEPEGRA